MRSVSRIAKRLLGGKTKKARVARKRYSYAAGQADVKIQKLEAYGTQDHTFTASTAAAPVAWSPLALFYASSMFTDHVQKMYQQWRLKSVTVRIGLQQCYAGAPGGLIAASLASANT